MRIGNRVEIGAGSCIDRGSWRDTVVGEGTKLDNHVQVGHNVSIGRSCLLCAHVALGGSSALGDFCVLGGKSAVADHVELVDHVRLAACAGVTKDITISGDYGGMPAQAIGSWRRGSEIVRTCHAPICHPPIFCICHAPVFERCHAHIFCVPTFSHMPRPHFSHPPLFSSPPVFPRPHFPHLSRSDLLPIDRRLPPPPIGRAGERLRASAGSSPILMHASEWRERGGGAE